MFFNKPDANQPLSSSRTGPLLLMLTALHLAAVPARAVDPNKEAKYQAQAAQAKLHHDQRLKAQQAKAKSWWLSSEPRTGSAQTAATQPLPGPEGPAYTGSTLAKLLDPGLLLLLAASTASPLTGFAQAPQAALPVFDGTSSASAVIQSFTTDPAATRGSTMDTAITQSLAYAFEKGNTTGALPSLEDLNARLANKGNLGAAPLAALLETRQAAEAVPLTASSRGARQLASTVPEAASSSIPAPATTPAPAAAPPGGAGPASGIPAGLGLLRPPSTLASPPPLSPIPAAATDPTDEMLAVLTTLTASRLIQTQGTLLSISYQLLAIAFAEDANNNANATTALRIAASELQSLGFAFGAQASNVQAESAERLLGKLEDKQRAQAEAKAAAEANENAFQTAASSEETFLDPGLIYGTWRRLENTLPAQLIMYKISRDEFVKINATTDHRGRRQVRTEAHPGAVSSQVSYALPPDDAAPEEEGPCTIKILIKQANHDQMTLDFSFLKAAGSAFGGNPGVVLDVLIEQDGERKAFVKISEY